MTSKLTEKASELLYFAGSLVHSSYKSCLGRGVVRPVLVH